MSDSKCNAQTYSTISRCQRLCSTGLGVPQEKPSRGAQVAASPWEGLGPGTTKH